jgi:transposase
MDEYRSCGCRNGRVRRCTSRQLIQAVRGVLSYAEGGSPNRREPLRPVQLTIGIDISKHRLDAYRLSDRRHIQVANDGAGLQALLKWIGGGEELPLVVFEATGAYHRRLEAALSTSDIPFARVNPRQARRFAERPAGWPRRIASRDHAGEDGSSSGAGRARYQLAARIKQIEMQLTQIDAAIASKVAEDEAMSSKLAILISIPGIGEATALSMLVEMPELGRLEGKQAASLASLAPISRQSGTWQGAAEGWRSPQIAARRGRGAGLRARPGRRGPRRARGSRGGRRRRRGRRSGGSRPGARRRARREGAAAGGRTPPSGRLHGAGGGGSCGCCEGASWLSSSRRRCPGRGRGGAGSCRRGRRGASGGGGRSPRAPTRACRGGWRRFRTGGVRGARASRRRARDGRTRCRRRDRCRGAGPGRGRHGSGGRRRRRSPRGAGAGAASGCRGSARSGARGRGCRRAGSRAMDREAGGRRYCVML